MTPQTQQALLEVLKGIQSLSHGGNSDIYQTACMAIALVESANKTSADDYVLVPRIPTDEDWEIIAFNLSSDFGPELVEHFGTMAKAFWRHMLTQVASPSHDKPGAGWMPIESAPKNKNVLGWGEKVGHHMIYWNGRQWDKCELKSDFRLGPKAITHYLPLPNPPSPSTAQGGNDDE